MTDEQKSITHRNRTQRGPQAPNYVGMDKQTREAVNKIAATKAGQLYLRWLMDYCGYKYTSLTMNQDGYILTDAMIHNEALRKVWLDTRKGIHPNLLNVIEMEEHTDVGKKITKKKD